MTGQTAGGYVSLTTLPIDAPGTSTLNFPLGRHPGQRGNRAARTRWHDRDHLRRPGRGNGPGDLRPDRLLLDGSGRSTYHVITPSRLVDTRTAEGLGASLAANSGQTFAVTGPAWETVR